MAQTVYPEARSETVLILPFTEASLSDPSDLLPVIRDVVTSCTLQRITVIFSTPKSKGDQLYPQLVRQPRTNFDRFQLFLGKIYAALASAQWSCGRVLMDVEVAFAGEDSSKWQRSNYAQTIQLGDHSELDIELPPTVLMIPWQGSSGSKDTAVALGAEDGYPTAALGGTFDHLHAAHKLLIHLGVLLAKRRLIVGVMADPQLSSKSNSQLVEPITKRIEAIEQFLQRRGLRKAGEDGEGIVMEVVEIQDAMGPTAWDADIQALIVSQETASGGAYVNKTRVEKGLPELNVYTVDVIGSTATNKLKGVTDEKILKELKMGSTGIRQWIAGHPDHQR